jgi:hypothetical protein
MGLVWGSTSNFRFYIPTARVSSTEVDLSRPLGLVRRDTFLPRLAPWAAFFRRFAAQSV